MVFPVVMCGCESWALKQGECQRIDAFDLQCFSRCLRIPWTARRSNQSILKEVSPEYALEWLMLKMKLQYFGHLMWRTDSLDKTLITEKDWRQVRWSGISISWRIFHNLLWSTQSKVVVLEGLVVLHRTVQLQLFQHYWLGHRLGLLLYWMVCVGNEQRSFFRFWDCNQAFWTFVD